jgi:hypothetical protein
MVLGDAEIDNYLDNLARDAERSGARLAFDDQGAPFPMTFCASWAGVSLGKVFCPIRVS